MSFEEVYRQACAEQRVRPYLPLLRRLHAATIDADLDFLPLPKWTPFLTALTKSATSFCHLRLALGQTNRDLPPPDDDEGSAAPVSIRKLQRDRAPTVPDANIVTKLCRSIAVLLANSLQLQTLELPGIPLEKKALAQLAPPLKHHGALQSLSIKDSRLGDSGFVDLLAALKGLRSLTALQVAGCALTDASGPALASLVKFHQSQRDGEQWVGSLRSDRPVMDSPGGLLFLDCSNNFLGDDTAKALAKALHEDSWLKGLDLARNRLGAAGAAFLHRMLCHNHAICYCNLSDNEGCDVVQAETITPWGGKWHRVQASTTMCVFTRDAQPGTAGPAPAGGEFWARIPSQRVPGHGRHPQPTQRRPSRSSTEGAAVSESLYAATPEPGEQDEAGTVSAESSVQLSSPLRRQLDRLSQGEGAAPVHGLAGPSSRRGSGEPRARPVVPPMSTAGTCTTPRTLASVGTTPRPLPPTATTGTSPLDTPRDTPLDTPRDPGLLEGRPGPRPPTLDPHQCLPEPPLGDEATPILVSRPRAFSAYAAPRKRPTVSTGSSPYPRPPVMSSTTSPHLRATYQSATTSPRVGAFVSTVGTSPHVRGGTTAAGTSPHLRVTMATAATSPHRHAPASPPPRRPPSPLAGSPLRRGPRAGATPPPPPPPPPGVAGRSPRPSPARRPLRAATPPRGRHPPRQGSPPLARPGSRAPSAPRRSASAPPPRGAAKARRGRGAEEDGPPPRKPPVPRLSRLNNPSRWPAASRPRAEHSRPSILKPQPLDMRHLLPPAIQVQEDSAFGPWASRATSAPPSLPRRERAVAVPQPWPYVPIHRPPSPSADSPGWPPAPPAANPPPHDPPPPRPATTPGLPAGDGAEEAGPLAAGSPAAPQPDFEWPEGLPEPADSPKPEGADPHLPAPSSPPQYPPPAHHPSNLQPHVHHHHHHQQYHHHHQHQQQQQQQQQYYQPQPHLHHHYFHQHFRHVQPPPSPALRQLPLLAQFSPMLSDPFFGQLPSHPLIPTLPLSSAGFQGPWPTSVPAVVAPPAVRPLRTPPFFAVPPQPPQTPPRTRAQPQVNSQPAPEPTVDPSSSYLYAAHMTGRLKVLPPDMDRAAFPTAPPSLPSPYRLKPRGGHLLDMSAETGSSTTDSTMRVLIGRLEHSERENQRLHALLAGLVAQHSGGPPQPASPGGGSGCLEGFEWDSGEAGKADPSGIGEAGEDGDQSPTGGVQYVAVDANGHRRATPTPPPPADRPRLFYASPPGAKPGRRMVDPVLEDPLLDVFEVEGLPPPVTGAGLHVEEQLREQQEVMAEILHELELGRQEQLGRDAQEETLRTLEQRQQHSTAQMIGVLEQLLGALTHTGGGALPPPAAAAAAAAATAGPGLGGPNTGRPAAQPFVASIADRLMHKYGAPRQEPLRVPL